MKKRFKENYDLLGTCWGGGFFDANIWHSKNDVTAVLLISERNAKACRYIYSHNISNVNVINDETQACIEGVTYTVKKYVLTLIDCKVLVCTVIKGDQSNKLENIIFGERQPKKIR